MSTRMSVAAVIALLLALDTGARAQGVIAACARKKSGALRLVSAGTSCRKSERAVSWNEQGPAGTPGADGSALAFAHVLSTAQVDAANSKNVADGMVTHGLGPGDFCFALPFTPRSIVVTVDLGSQDTGFATAQLGASAGNCPPTASASVHVSVATNPPHGEDDAFFVVFN